MDHYVEHELPQRRHSTQQSHSSTLNRWIRPRWGDSLLEQVKSLAVEEWLRSLALAPKSKVNLRDLFHLIYEHARRWELTDRNPIGSELAKSGPTPRHGHKQYSLIAVARYGWLETRVSFSSRRGKTVFVQLANTSLKLTRSRKLRMAKFGSPKPPTRFAKSPVMITTGYNGWLFDDTGSLWIGTVGDGIGRIRSPKQLEGREAIHFVSAVEVERFSQKDGLSADDTSAVLQDREGNIWIGTDTGLDRFRETMLVPSGLPPGANDMLLIPGDHGNLWTGSLNRIVTHIDGKSIRVQQPQDGWANACGYLMRV
jgi:ligand-binding sensor domain-containing protein